MHHIVNEDAADCAARCLRNVENLDDSFGRPYWRQFDREPPRNGPAGIENDQVQCERRKRVDSGIGDDEIGAATAALLLKFVELKADRF